MTLNNTTKRVVSEHLESILYDAIPALDHGLVRVIDYMGDDTSIVQAARVSYGAGTKKSSQDKGLINYLMRNKHTTPFEMCELKLHIKLPIFVARQWIRHRTASVNEYSARYSILSKEFYLPQLDKIAPQSTTNKQGREGEAVSRERASHVLSILKSDAERCYDSYLDMINEDVEGNIIDDNKIGITRELARMNLNLNYYTEFYWKIDLHNLLHFLRLRADHHAQYEIRVYAEIILDIVKKWVPYTFEAFDENIIQGISLSRTEVQLIRSMIRGETFDQKSSGLSKRAWSSFNKNFLE